MTVSKPQINNGQYLIFDIFGIHYDEKISSIMMDIFTLDEYQSNPIVIYKDIDKSVIKEIAKQFINEYNNVKISNTIHSISNIKNVSGATIFDNQKNTKFGWLIFVDKNILANWGHECEYIFYIDTNDYTITTNTMPPENIGMEEIE